MAITFPINIPTTIGVESITFNAVDTTVVTTSPFTLQQQVLDWGGQRWEVSASIPPVRRDLSAEWKAFLLSLRGHGGTFLMGDPDYQVPRGTARSGNASGTEGESTVTFSSLNGSLEPGDYFQIGGGVNTRLYTVLEYVNGSGEVSIWPNLRSDLSNTAIVLTNPKGHFRLSDRSRRYSINTNSTYGISFDAVEVV